MFLIKDLVAFARWWIPPPSSPDYVVIESDADGMRSDSLRRSLEAREGKDEAPRLMYINPTGANPTGTVMSAKRKKEIYDICCEYDILILEDDPYFYLQLCEEKTPSIWSMDHEGRVLRFDSFSKILGWEKMQQRMLV